MLSKYFKISKKTKITLTLLLLLQLVGLRILAAFPGTVETYYSRGFYPVFSKLLRYLFGWVPFSVGDLCYAVLALVLLWWLWRNFRRLWRKPLGFFLDVAAGLSVFYFIFNLFWGLNYYRLPLHQTLGLDSDYTTEQLMEVTQKLVGVSAGLHHHLGYADSVKVDFPQSQKELMQMTTNGYENIGQRFPGLIPHPKSIKKSGGSLGLTYMGYSGYYNPFTAEAQVNRKITTYMFPVVACHEEAHQLGYAAENEANFLAFLSATNNENLYFQYAGYIFALRYCLNELARRDWERYLEIESCVPHGILEAYREMRDFWAGYESPLEDVAKLFFDTFLKANNQEKGIRSYSYMVALVVNYMEGV